MNFVIQLFNNIIRVIVRLSFQENVFIGVSLPAEIIGIYIQPVSYIISRSISIDKSLNWGILCNRIWNSDTSINWNLKISSVSCGIKFFQLFFMSFSETEFHASWQMSKQPIKSSDFKLSSPLCSPSPASIRCSNIQRNDLLNFSIIIWFRGWISAVTYGGKYIMLHEKLIWFSSSAGGWQVA